MLRPIALAASLALAGCASVSATTATSGSGPHASGRIVLTPSSPAAQYARAMDAFRAHDRADDWTPATCASVVQSLARATHDTTPARFPEPWLARAIVHGRCGERTAAREALARVLTTRAEPVLCRGRAQLAVYEWEDGRHDAALALLESAVTAWPVCTEAVTNLAMLLRERSAPGDLARAHVLLRRVSFLAPGYAPAWHQRALLELAEPDGGVNAAERASSLCERAVELVRAEGVEASGRRALLGEVFNTWGVASLRAGDARALSRFESAMEFRPDAPEVLLNVGALRLSVREDRGAGEAFARVLAVRPGHYDALVGMGTALRRIGCREQAIAAYRAARAREPQRPDAYYDEAITELDARCFVRGGGEIADLSRGLQLGNRFITLAGQEPRYQAHVARMRAEMRHTNALPQLTQYVPPPGEGIGCVADAMCESGDVLRWSALIPPAATATARR